MRKDNSETMEVKIPSRRQFINKAGLVAGGVLISCITLFDACNLLESTDTESSTQSQSLSYTLPVKITLIENLPEVRTAVSAEKEQLISFSEALKQFQLDVNELDITLSRLDGMNELTEEISLRLQILMDRRSKFIQTLSQMMKKISITQDILVQNMK